MDIYTSRMALAFPGMLSYCRTFYYLADHPIIPEELLVDPIVINPSQSKSDRYLKLRGWSNKLTVFMYHFQQIAAGELSENGILVSPADFFRLPCSVFL